MDGEENHTPLHSHIGCVCPSPAVGASVAGVCVVFVFVCLLGQSQTWLFALLPQIELYSPAACHFDSKAQLLSSQFKSGAL